MMKKFFILTVLFFVAYSLYTAVGPRLYAHLFPPPPPAARPEMNITIIPGWNIRQIADDWVKNGLATSTAAVYAYIGYPPEFPKRAPTKELPFLAEATSSVRFALVKDKPSDASYEGYLYPDTYRVYRDASIPEVLKKIFLQLEKQVTPEMRLEMKKQHKSFFEIVTVASLLEKEARNTEEMSIISDILWRRYQINWALQLCSTVNYVTGKSAFAVSAQDRLVDSPYNTYRYRGLPPGPISSVGDVALSAALYPQANSYWYFMTGNDGVMRYGRTLAEHDQNIGKYLR